MMPFIHDGDILTIAPLTSAYSRLGEVVAFVHPGNGKLIVHRVLRICGVKHLIQGDARCEADGWVQSSRILGRVVAVERSGKNIRFGLGAERVAIAWLHHHKSLWKLARIIGRTMRNLK